MTRQAITTTGAPAAVGPYSQAIGAATWCSARARSGSIRATGELVDGGIEAQAERALRNLSAVLDAAGVGLRRRREDDDLPGRHRRLRRRQRDLREAHAGPAARPLDVRGRGAAEGCARRDRGDRRARPLTRCPATSGNGCGAAWIDTPFQPTLRCADPSHDHPIDTAGDGGAAARPASHLPTTPPPVNPPSPSRLGRTLAVVLAAGLGTRMRSRTPKLLHPLLGRPMLAYVGRRGSRGHRSPGRSW